MVPSVLERSSSGSRLTSLPEMPIKILPGHLPGFEISKAGEVRASLTNLATPPATLQTSLVTKKDQRFDSLQWLARSSRSNSSPIGIPQPESKTSWSAQSSRVAATVISNNWVMRLPNIRQHSKLGWSPATAEKLLQIHSSTALLCSTPARRGGTTDANSSICSCANLLKAST